MNENNKNFDNDNNYDSLKDVTEFQNNMFNPGHYIATGRIPPTVSAPGNATPLVIVYFLAAIIFLVLGLFLFFSDISVISLSLIKSPLLNKIIVLIIMLAIVSFFLFLGFGYLRKAKRYYKEKTNLEKEEIYEEVEDKIWQRTCPKCGKSHDIDYPKCPNCKFDYLK